MEKAKWRNRAEPGQALPDGRRRDPSPALRLTPQPVVIGAAFGNVVQALVKDIVTPIIGAFGGVPDFSAWFFTVNGSKFLTGDFINALLGFLVIAAVVYYFVVLPCGRRPTAGVYFRVDSILYP